MSDDEGAPTYTVERILRKRVQKGKVQYFIKWKGWPASSNTWEPVKHICDEGLIDDFNDRNRKSKKRKPVVRKRVATRPTSTRATRTRHLQSSSSSEPAAPSPIINDENSLLKTKLDDEPAAVHTSRVESADEDESTSLAMDKPKLDESIRELLWQPAKVPHATTSITEVTDQTGVTVLIREVTDLPMSGDNRTARFLGYGNGGRGGRH